MAVVDMVVMVVDIVVMVVDMAVVAGNIMVGTVRWWWIWGWNRVWIW